MQQLFSNTIVYMLQSDHYYTTQSKVLKGSKILMTNSGKIMVKLVFSKSSVITCFLGSYS